MSTPVKDLNEIAGKSPRKSPRKRKATEPVESEPAPKRPSPDATVSPKAGTKLPSSSKKSRKSLKRRSSVKFVPEPRSGEDGYEIPADGGADKVPVGSAVSKETGTVNVELKRPKKLRLLKHAKNKQANPSPFKGMPHGALRPEEVVGATLTSTDSPAKNTRKKTTNPLQVLEKHPIQEAPKLPTRREPPGSRRKSNLRQVFTTENADSGNDYQEPAADSFRQSDADRDQLQQQSIVGVNNDGTDEDSGQADVEYSTRDSSTRKRSEKTGKPQGQQKAAEIKKPRLPKTSKSVGESSGQNAQEKEAQRQADKEKERQQRAANAAESAVADREELEAFRIKFVNGVEDPAMWLSLYDAFADLGAGALYIQSKFPRKDKMSTSRAEAVARSLSILRQGFQDHHDQGDGVLEDEHEVQETLSILRHRTSLGDDSHPPFLHERPSNSQNPDEQTVIDIYGYLIPRCSLLLKRMLQVRWDGVLSLKALKELRKVAKVLTDLCTIAMTWLPRPKTLETGIMAKVRQKVKPNADTIRERIGVFIEYQERRQYEEMIELERLEHIRKMRKLRLTGNQRNDDHQRLAQLSIRQRQAPQRHVDDISDDDVAAKGPSFSRTTLDHQQPEIDATPSPRLQRRMTEEIPAPDPNSSWTRREDIALLNSLQEYTDDDRFERILATCPQLRHKDLDELIARAKFHRRSSGKDAEERGYWWLLNIPV